MAVTPPVVLTIAGFDPSSGAGITADIKTIAAHECYGVSCITALTVQSTQGVRRVEGVDPKIVAETLQELVSDLAVEAVHIGMLGNGRWSRWLRIFWIRPGSQAASCRAGSHSEVEFRSGLAGCGGDPAIDREAVSAGGVGHAEP